MVSPDVREVETPYEKWTLLNLRRKDDLEYLRRILLPGEELSVPAQSVFDYVLRPGRGKKLPLCQSVFVEDDYFDQDFVDSISRFYSKGFRSINRLCKRLHFFSSKLNVSDIEKFLVETTAHDKLQGSYHGFCVVRPLETKRLGRSILKPRRERPEIEFHTCTARSCAHVAGTELSVESAPYMEQDGRVQTCSSVAIWISTTVMAQCFGYPQYSTSEIMAKATSTLVGARAGPTEGLTYEQIMQALYEMGYEPLILDEADPPEAKHRVYSYVESRIPPLLLLELPDGNHHAVTAIGHAHSRPLQAGSQVTISKLGRPILQYFRSSEWVPYFYVHDDQMGIYRQMRFLEADPSRLEQRIRDSYRGTSLAPSIKVNLRQWHCPVCINIDSTLTEVPKETIANLWGVIIPLPRGIALSHSEAEEKAAQVIRRCADHWRVRLAKDLVLRTYLVSSNDYKSRLRQHSEMNRYVRMMYLGKPLPKWLWLTEMSTVDLMNRVHLDRLRIRGELILDATGNPWPTDFIAFHWIDTRDNGILLTMKQDEPDIREALRSASHGPDKPYSPLLR